MKTRNTFIIGIVSAISFLGNFQTAQAQDMQISSSNSPMRADANQTATGYVRNATGYQTHVSVIVTPTPNMICDSLETLFAGGNGQDGNMFDVTAITNVQITSFEGNIDGSGGTMEIYYRVGTHVGNETNAAAWTLLGSALVTPVSTGVPTAIPIPVNLTINASQTYAFYITGNTTGNMLDYTDGTAVGNIYVQNGNIQIKEGTGNAYPFGSTFDPRIWNGIINYCTGPAGTQDNVLSTERGVNVYPNPSNGEFQIQVIDNQYSITGIEIYSVMGEKVYQSPNSELRTHISLDVPAGIYYYRVNDASGTVRTGKIVME
ncbi:MAG: T9SS type A sorting domain-containing protein [Bacteroidota bacterium]